MKNIFKLKECKLTKTEKWLDSHLVTFPVSYNYNGGIILDDKGNRCFDGTGKWYKGINVPKPKAPKGFKLTSIGVGLQLNSCPPYATMYLKPIKE